MKIILFLAMLAFPFLAMGQTISGKVTNFDGTPLKGVKVMATGTTQGTLTDANGMYALKVLNGGGISELVFTAREFKKPMKIEVENGIMSDTKLNVTMHKKKKKRSFVMSN